MVYCSITRGWPLTSLAVWAKRCVPPEEFTDTVDGLLPLWQRLDVYGPVVGRVEPDLLQANKGMIRPSAFEGRLPKCVNLQFQPDGIHSPPGEAMFMGDSSNGLLG